MILDAKILFRLRTLTIDYGEGNIQHLPLNFLQEQADNDSTVCGFKLLNKKNIELQFEDQNTSIFDPLNYL